MTDSRISELEETSPSSVWRNFLKLTSIPRISGHEQAAAAWIMEKAAAAGAAARRDAAGNVIIDVPSHPERVDAPGVILQGHLDMVPAVEPGFVHDLTTQPPKVLMDDGWVKANHTSLGADNGIGIAIMLALMEDKYLKHGPLRLIITVEEETTMRGANELAAAELDLPYLINLDSEDNSKACVSCAGSKDLLLTFIPEWVVPEDCRGLKLSLEGLSGGHSGTDIFQGRANAIKVMAAMLTDAAREHDFFLCDISGGKVRNAIPDSCSARLAVPAATAGEVRATLEVLGDIMKRRYAHTDQDMRLSLVESEVAQAMDYHDGLCLLRLLNALPNGVLRQWDREQLVPETSINTGVITTAQDAVTVQMMARSLNDAGLDEVCRQVDSLCRLLPEDLLTCAEANAHPCWHQRHDPHLLTCLNSGLDSMLWVTAVHAGLECAIFHAKNPSLHQISIGPTILNPHSCFERVRIEDVRTTYSGVRRALELI